MVTWNELEDYVRRVYTETEDWYGLSKAALHKYTEISAKENPNLKINAVWPGYVDTPMSKGMHFPLTPE